MGHRKPSLLIVKVWLGSVLAVLSACGAPSDSRIDLESRDSADIRIVTSPAPSWSGTQGWRLSDEPVLEIGLQEGPEEYVFSGINDVVRLPDGRVVVIDRMSSQIRFFSSEGEYLFLTGGTGEGPGEYFRAYKLTAGAGDSIYVVDTGGSPRSTVLLTDGSLARTYTIRPESNARGRSVHTILRDGRLVVYGGGRGRNLDNGRGFIRDTLSYFLWSADADYLGPMATLRGGDRWSRPELGMFLDYIPFQPGFWKAAGLGDRVMLGNGIEPEIQLWGPGPNLETLVRWDAPPRQVTRELKEEYEARRLDEVEGDADATRNLNKWLSEVPYPDKLPAYEEFLADDQGNIWVQEYQLPWETGGSWTVLSPDFRWMGFVTTPPGFRIHHVAEGMVTGVHRDGLGVARVRAYLLLKPEVGK